MDCSGCGSGCVVRTRSIKMGCRRSRVSDGDHHHKPFTDENFADVLDDLLKNQVMETMREKGTR